MRSVNTMRPPRERHQVKKTYLHLNMRLLSKGALQLDRHAGKIHPAVIISASLAVVLIAVVASVAFFLLLLGH